MLPESLPDGWINSLFSRLQVRYGTAWLSMWNGIDIEAVKADWAHELAGFANKPAAIRHGLENLPPDRPPTVGQFRVLCRNAPELFPPALPLPAATAEQKAAVRSLLEQARSRITRTAA